MIMKCIELENLALDYLEGALGDAQRAEMESHLASCGGCAIRLHDFSNGFGSLQTMLEEWPSMSASRSFDGEILARIGPESRGGMGWWEQLFAPFFASLSRPAFAGTFSAVLLAAFALIRFYPPAQDAANLSRPAAPAVVALDTGDEVALVQGLNDLDDIDMLRNFEVLQEMKGPTP